jgi:hypothetical protein
VAAVLGTQAAATLIAVYGVFMPPIGWGWAVMVWGYALAWFLINDRVKLVAYRVFDPNKTPLLVKQPLPLERVTHLGQGKPMKGAWQGSRIPRTCRMMNGPLWSPT